MSSKKISRPLSQSEGFGHIEAYLRSGLRPSEYYQRHNLSEWQFYQWRKRYQKQHPEVFPPNPVNPKKFHPVSISSDARAIVVGSDLEVDYPNGVKVLIRDSRRIDIEQLLILIKQGV